MGFLDLNKGDQLVENVIFPIYHVVWSQARLLWKLMQMQDAELNGLIEWKNIF